MTELASQHNDRTFADTRPILEWKVGRRAMPVRWNCRMNLRDITADDLAKIEIIELPAAELERIDWSETGTGWWRIVAEISCSSCGAYQAIDSDPTNDRDVATTLAVKLFNEAGWRGDADAGVLCGDCT